MAHAAGVRFVRCPKCRSLLPEPTNVPIYQCAQCGTALRSKCYNMRRQGLSFTSSETNQSQHVKSYENFDTVVPSSGEKLVSSCSNGRTTTLDGAEEKKSSSDMVSLCLNEVQDSHDKTKAFSSPRGDIEEIVENSMHLSYQGPNGSIMDQRNEEPVQSPPGLSVSSDENLIGEGRISRLGSENPSLAYDAGLSSSDYISEIRVSNKFSNLRTRTSRNQRSDNIYDILHGRYEAVNIISKSLDHKKSFGMERNSSLDSDEFLSVRSCMDLEKDNTSQYQERVSSFLPISLTHHDARPTSKLSDLEDDRLELQKKVNELRYHLSSLCSGHEEKQASISGSNQPCCSCIHCSPLYSYPASTYQSGYDHLLEPARGPKKQPARRYCLPVLGGAPFVICDKCLQILQLPVEFVPWKGRKHKVKCGKCSKILVVTLQSRVAKLVKRPPFDQGGPNVDDPVSFSDEYGLPCEMSFSNEDLGAGNVVPLHELLGYSSARHVLAQPLE